MYKRYINLKSVLLVEVIVTFLVGCASHPVTSVVFSPSPGHTPLPSSTLTVSTVVTTTPVITIAPPTGTSLPGSSVTQKCVSLASTKDNNPMSAGSLVYQTSIDNKTWLLPYNALSAQEFYYSPSILYVSPYTGNLGWLEKQNLVIYKSNNEEVRYPSGKDWLGIRQWLPDDGLLIDIKPQNPETYYSPPALAVDEFIILHSLTQPPERRSIDLSGFFATGMVLQYWRSTPIYSPDLSKAIYGSFKDGTPTSDLGMVLWDAEHQVELWSQWNFGWPLEQTSVNWNLPGDKVVITAPSLDTDASYPPELISVSLDGKATQLTHLSTDKTNSDYLIWNAKWSPNSRYVAFVFNPGIDPQHNRWLYILDVETGVVTNYCLDSIGVRSKLFWSPDSRQLAFTIEDHKLVVLDVTTGETDTLITEESPNMLTLVGWANWTLNK